MASVFVQASGRNMRPSCASSRKTGRNETTMMTSEKKSAGPTCLAAAKRMRRRSVLVSGSSSTVVYRRSLRRKGLVTSTGMFRLGDVGGGSIGTSRSFGKMPIAVFDHDNAGVNENSNGQAPGRRAT